MKPQIQDFINGKVTYDKEGQYFFVNTPNGGVHLLGELRGWGHLFNMFVKTNKMDLNEAYKFQDEIGEFIAGAINNRIKLRIEP